MTTAQKKTIQIKTNGVSTGKDKTKISLSCLKNQDNGKDLTPAEAEAFFAARRLLVKLTQDDEQMTLTGIPRAEIEATCDVNSYGSNGKAFTTTLKFNADEVPIEKLAPFQFSRNLLEMELVGPSEDEDDDE